MGMEKSNLSDLSGMSAQALMGTGQFGLAVQALQAANALSDLSPRLT